MVGGILGVLISVISLTLVPFMVGLLGYGYGVVWQYGGMMMNKYYMFGYPQVGLDMMPSVMVLWSLLGLVGGVSSIFSALRLRLHYTSNTIFVGAIGGMLLLLSFSWLSSLMVLTGSLLLYFE